MKAIALILIAAAIASAVSATEVASTAPQTVPCRVQRRAPAVFPLRMLEQGVVRGEATVVLELDATGRIADQLVTAYTHPEFAKEATRVLRDWTFAPGLSNGEPVVCVITVTFEFSVGGVAVFERHFDSLPLDDYSANKFAYFAHGPSTLDRRPSPVNMTAPIYPKAWIEQGRRGSVTLRFFIDETGRARVPTIAAGSDDYLASAAIAALKDWRFQPPTAGGKPVLVCAEQVFNFEPQAVATK